MTKTPTKKNRKEKDFFEDFFETDALFDEYMTRIEEHMAMIFEEMSKGVGETKGFVYGFSMTSGPDGKPLIQEFGNTIDEPEDDAFEIGDETKIPEREPLIDVMEGAQDIRVIAEVPGYNAEDVKVEVKENKVSIKARNGKRTFSKEITLLSEVKQDETKTSYKNGVLEIVLKRV
jgi:HSP20 family protein